MILMTKTVRKTAKLSFYKFFLLKSWVWQKEEIVKTGSLNCLSCTFVFLLPIDVTCLK